MKKLLIFLLLLPTSLTSQTFIGLSGGAAHESLSDQYGMIVGADVRLQPGIIGVEAGWDNINGIDNTFDRYSLAATMQPIETERWTLVASLGVEYNDNRHFGQDNLGAAIGLELLLKLEGNVYMNLGYDLGVSGFSKNPRDSQYLTIGGVLRTFLSNKRKIRFF